MRGRADKGGDKGGGTPQPLRAAEAPRLQPGPRGESGRRTARQRQGAVLPPQGGATAEVTSHACAANSAGPGELRYGSGNGGARLRAA